MARGCVYGYNCSLTTSSSIFLPAMPQWLQASEQHLFHSLVIAPSWKKNPNRPTCSSEDTLAWSLLPSYISKWQGQQRGEEERKCGSNRFPLLKSQHRRRFTCTRVQKTAKTYLAFICRTGRRAGRYGHLGCPQLVQSKLRSCVSQSCAMHRECQSVPQYLVFFEIPFKAYLRVSKTT